MKHREQPTEPPTETLVVDGPTFSCTCGFRDYGGTLSILSHADTHERSRIAQVVERRTQHKVES